MDSLAKDIVEDRGYPIVDDIQPEVASEPTELAPGDPTCDGTGDGCDGASDAHSSCYEHSTTDSEGYSDTLDARAEQPTRGVTIMIADPLVNT